MRGRTCLAAIITTAAVGLAGCGGHGDGHGGSGSQGGSVDRAFATEMIPHHESAVEMGELARDRAETAFVRDLASDIVASQAAEIEILRAADARLAEAGAEPGELGAGHGGHGFDADVDELRAAEEFDETFLRLMIPHHEGAIEMARIELDRGTDAELKALAQDIIDAQQREIDAMRKALRS
jgi:uncharacterized protein (DUF305 family)